MSNPIILSDTEKALIRTARYKEIEKSCREIIDLVTEDPIDNIYVMLNEVDKLQENIHASCTRIRELAP